MLGPDSATRSRLRLAQFHAERQAAGPAAGAGHGEEDRLLLLLVDIGAVEHGRGLLLEQFVKREVARTDLRIDRGLTRRELRSPRSGGRAAPRRPPAFSSSAAASRRNLLEHPSLGLGREQGDHDGRDKYHESEHEEHVAERTSRKDGADHPRADDRSQPQPRRAGAGARRAPGSDRVRPCRGRAQATASRCHVAHRREQSTRSGVVGPIHHSSRRRRRRARTRRRTRCAGRSGRSAARRPGSRGGRRRRHQAIGQRLLERQLENVLVDRGQPGGEAIVREIERRTSTDQITSVRLR